MKDLVLEFLDSLDSDQGEMLMEIFESPSGIEDLISVLTEASGGLNEF